MKLFSILILLNIMCFNNPTINTGKFVIDINSNQVACELRISADLTYEIWLSYQASEDIVNSAVLSYGHYSFSDNKLILHDDYFNFDWDMLIKDNRVSIGSGYAFLNGKKVLKHRAENIVVTPPNDDCLGRIQAQIDRFISQQANPRMVIGQYEDQNHDYSLKINQNGKYQLYLKDVLLSEGDWSQQDNLLVLHDVRLNHDFSLAIGERSLLSLGIPGEFGGTLLTLIKNK